MNKNLHPVQEIFEHQSRPEESEVILIPLPFDATASYGTGSSKGPEHIRKASSQLDFYDVEMGMPVERGIALLAENPEIPELNRKATEAVQMARQYPAESQVHQKACQRADAAATELRNWLFNETTHWLQEGKIPGIIGGDHSTPLGAIEACAAHYPDMGVLHIDAHADLRIAYEGFEHSHASIMHNVLGRTAIKTLVQVGVRDLSQEEKSEIESNTTITTFFDNRMARSMARGTNWGNIAYDIVAALPETIYISMDIDGLDPTLCPGTGTPVPGGLSFHQFEHLLRVLREEKRRVIGFDLVEVTPSRDGSEWDGNVGARVLYRLAATAMANANQR
ncbi:agmatinase family protein [Myxococcota bacterium]|nr:agmatinase family protein [Myxococcota bacterium]